MHTLCQRVCAAQILCKHCNKNMRDKRSEDKAAELVEKDKGVWQDTSRAVKVMEEAMERSFLRSDGRAHICVLMFLEDAKRNPLRLFGEQHGHMSCCTTACWWLIAS